jgi:multiple sugar transport system substrate-binding protein
MRFNKEGSIKWIIISIVLVLTLATVTFAGSEKKEKREGFDIKAVKGPALEELGLAPISDETVYFRGWQYKSEIVKNNVERYNTALDGNVDYATITGDYPSIVETKFIANAPLDVVYANAPAACRYYDGGWIMTAEELPNIDQIKADMYPNILDAWTYKGKLLGLSYFVSTRGMLHANLQKLQEVGMSESDLPTTWDELWDQLFVLRDKGIKYPFLPHWFNEWYGITLQFEFEVLNRGGKVAHPETHKPMISADGPAGETLKDWKRAWNAGLIPKEVLGYLEPDYLDAWGSGEYVYSPQQTYDLKRFNEERYSNFAGYCIPVPYKGQSWGLINSAMYLMSSRPDRSNELTRDVMAFFLWYGYKDHEGKMAVHQRWMEESMLFSAYRSVMEDPQNSELMKKVLARPQDYQTTLKVYEETPYAKGVNNVVWSTEFNSWLKETLQVFLTEDKPIDETVNKISDKINELNDLYGIQ